MAGPNMGAAGSSGRGQSLGSLDRVGLGAQWHVYKTGSPGFNPGSMPRASRLVRSSTLYPSV
jgi:hypothetical protein